MEAQSENYTTSTLHYRKLEVESCGNFSADDLPSTFFSSFYATLGPNNIKSPISVFINAIHGGVSRLRDVGEYFYFANPNYRQSSAYTVL